MTNWFTENWTDGVRFSIRSTLIHHEKSPFQEIHFYDSEDMGRFFTLDGCMMVTEKDEWVYHDMITHVPLAVNPKIKRALVIGGGDGGTVRELTRYPTIETIELVEIDQRVVELSRDFLPTLTSGLDDPRVSIHYKDGIDYVEKAADATYDLILIDSTDPFGPGESLFTENFYHHCHRALTDEGIVINQHESPYFPNYAKQMQRVHQKMKKIFPIAEVYNFHQPCYPSGFWLFGFSSKTLHPLDDHKPDAWNLKCKYYNKEIHRGAFAQPTFMQEQLAHV